MKFKFISDVPAMSISSLVKSPENKGEPKRSDITIDKIDGKFFFVFLIPSNIHRATRNTISKPRGNSKYMSAFLQDSKMPLLGMYE